jgi:hypothetical protein
VRRRACSLTTVRLVGTGCSTLMSFVKSRV